MNTQKKSQTENVEIGALWQRSSQSGQSYLTGTLNLKGVGIDKQIPIVIFNNKFKTADNQPDLRIYVSRPKQDTTTTSENKVAPKKTTAPKSESAEPQPEDNRDII